MIQLKRKDLTKVRAELYERQGGKCILCERSFDDIQDTPCVDHCHQSGYVRALLCRHCNSQAGKIENRAIRAKQGLTKMEWLNNFHTYITAEHTEYLHPSVAPKAPKLGKRLFNKIKKHYPKIEYPKSGKITKKIQELINRLEAEDLL
jgi:hypothetical protein